jgi:hypothetical protein
MSRPGRHAPQHKGWIPPIARMLSEFAKFASKLFQCHVNLNARLQ